MKANVKIREKQVVTLQLDEKEIHALRIALGIMLYEDCSVEELFEDEPDELKRLLKVSRRMFNQIDNLI